MLQLDVRPEHEVRYMSSAEVAGMKAREHAIQVGRKKGLGGLVTHKASFLLVLIANASGRIADAPRAI